MTVRWGIFGAGRMARRFSNDVRLSQTGQLVAVASRSVEAAQRFGSNVRAMASYGDLAAADDIDAIYVATPNSTHKDLCLLALNAGKAVLCEKPMVTRPDDLEEIMETADRMGLPCLEGMWSLFLPGMRHAKAIIDKGHLGTIVHAHASLGFTRSEVEGDPITDAALGGGALFDLGIYCVAAFEHLLGPSEPVDMQVTRSTAGSIRNVTALLRHMSADGSGVLSTFSASHDTVLDNRITIAGTRGRIEFDSPFLQVQSARRWSFESQPYSRGKPEPRAVSNLKSLSLWPKIRRAAKRAIGSGGVAIPCDYPGSGFQFQIDEIAGQIAQTDKNRSVALRRECINRLNTLDKIAGSHIA